MSIMETNKINEVIPFRAVHPSEVIKDELKARGMTQKELAHRMGMQQSNLSRLIKGENITPAVARKLEEAFDIPADFWVSLQSQYDRDVKSIAVRDEKERAAINAERMLANMLNLPELYKRLKINPALFVQEKLSILQDALGFYPLEIGQYAITQQSCFKKNDKYSVDEKNQTTWLTLAYIESRKHKLDKPFSLGKAKSAAQQISKRAHEGGLKEAEIVSILNSCSISYSVVEKLEKTPIDAVSMNIDGMPAIVTTHRIDDMSRLIFDILHELGHIELHMFSGTDSIFINGGTEYSGDSQMEKQANRFAQDILIDPTVWNKMMSEGTRNLRMSNIANCLKRLSKEYNLDCDIVTWRYKYESSNYKLFGAKPAHIR